MQSCNCLQPIKVEVSLKSEIRLVAY
nr:unnamed protein product [Callosobruchus analis]